MPARTGAEYIEGLRARPPDLWIEGQRVADVTRHPAFRNVIRSLATLYDMQQDPALREEMTYVSPSSGQRVGLSFLVPRSREDLVRVRAMMKRWADYSGGMMGRTPDYLNRSLLAYATAAWVPGDRPIQRWRRGCSARPPPGSSCTAHACWPRCPSPTRSWSSRPPCCRPRKRTGL